MKFFTAGFLMALVAVANANLVKDKLQQFRDPEKVDKSRLVEKVNDRYEKYVNKLSDKINDNLVQLREHDNGNRRLGEEEHARLLTQVTNFQRKLSTLKDMNEQEKAEMLGSTAEERFRMNAVDYLDFDA